MQDLFLDGYCSTVYGLLDWFEVDLGFTELLFIQILYLRISMQDPAQLPALHYTAAHCNILSI